MTDKIDISSGRYWDRAWSLVEGCTPVSAACDNCWLASIDHRFGKNIDSAEGPIALTDSQGKFRGEVNYREDRLVIPHLTKKPTVWSIWSDLFHSRIPDSFIERAFNIMYNEPRHTFLVLTKRPERMADFFLGTSGAGSNFDYPNIWLGTTVENQFTADERIPYLLNAPGMHFLSIEPMLGKIDLRMPAFNGADSFSAIEGIHAVICGGESGVGARPMNLEWVRSLRDQCHVAGIPFFFKQWGEWVHKSAACFNSDPFSALSSRNATYYVWEGGTRSYRLGTKRAGRILDGRTHDDLPWVKK